MPSHATYAATATVHIGSTVSDVSEFRNYVMKTP
jgi:hypothetical protein